MQIKCLSNGSYSLKNCHNPFGKAFQPTPPYGKIPVEHLKSLHGSSLTFTLKSILHHLNCPAKPSCLVIVNSQDGCVWSQDFYLLARYKYKRSSRATGPCDSNIGNTSSLRHHRHHCDWNNFHHHCQVGVDPVMRRRIWEHLELLSSGSNCPTTTIITTHYIEEARGADR